MVSSNTPHEAVVDSTTLQHFLLVDRADLLLKLFGGRITVSRIVYDGDDPRECSAPALSEIALAISYYAQRARDHTCPPGGPAAALRDAQRMRRVHELHNRGSLNIADMTEDELTLYGALTCPERMPQVGLRFPLGRGEAASVALVTHRGLTLVTDDNDALIALRAVSPSHRSAQIRTLLAAAADAGYITSREAQRVHDAMRAAGLRDSESFPVTDHDVV